MLSEGWMHNRLRMVVAMFFTKNMLHDWRLGEKFFMQHLIDGDFSSNNGGWQWSSSTGTDSAPYFRIFNPITQSQNFDPDGEFIKKFIPELKDFMERQAFQLSGGQQKLVALARAMVVGKKLLLLDEPFEGVAPALAERLVELISSLNKSNLITMITESDETFSKKIKADIIRIERGKIL